MEQVMKRLMYGFFAAMIILIILSSILLVIFLIAQSVSITWAVITILFFGICYILGSVLDREDNERKSYNKNDWCHDHCEKLPCRFCEENE